MVSTRLTRFTGLLALAAGTGLLRAEDAAPVAEAVAEVAPEVAPVVVSALNSGDTAWMIVACGLVLFMTLPGLALFYGGLVRAKNVLNILMACFACAGMISVLWAIYGYSLAFDVAGMEKGVVGLRAFIGGLSHAFMSGVTVGAETGSIPTTVFAMFQMTFAIITPALIVGAFAERMRFWPMMIFSALWFTVVYLPICHMTWSGVGGLFWDWGVVDFAGGTVVHINAGVAGLVAALVLGKRTGYPNTPMKPHNLTLAATGAGMLWVGWFGFNAGSALAANHAAGNALLVTHLATAAACVAWMLCEQIKHGKPSLLGAISGAVAGLVAITPAAGVAGPMGSLLLGAVAGIVCFWGVTSLKKLCGYDDALDAFGVHGVGGIVGAILTAVVAMPLFQGLGAADYNVGKQLGTQALAVLVTVAWTGILTFVILKVLDLTIGLRVTPEDESRGLDIALHGEEAYNG